MATSTLAVDDLMDEYDKKPWDSCLVFPGTVLCVASEAPEMHQYNEKADDVDIFKYTSSLYKGMYIRFDPQAYNVHRVESDEKFAKETDGWKLIQNIVNSLGDNGQGAFILNGSKAWSHSKKYTQHEICCTRYRIYQSRRALDDPLQSDKRSTKTSLALVHKKKCTCHMTIHADEIGYFISCGTGNSTHIYHPIDKFGVGQDDQQGSLVDSATGSQNQPRNVRIDRYNEMLSIWKPLCSLLEHCDDAFCEEIKKKVEIMVSDMVRRVHEHIANKSTKPIKRRVRPKIV